MSFETIPLVAVIVSAVASATSAFLSQFAKRNELITAANEKTESEERNYSEEIRIPLIQKLLQREIERYGIFRMASNLLIFSQFVVGGVLASSLTTKALGETVVGLLGLVVLASSLINQHYRPDILSKASGEKLRQLRSLKRKLEDELYVATRSGISDEALIKIRLLATETLEKIELSEQQTLQTEKQQSA